MCGKIRFEQRFMATSVSHSSGRLHKVKTISYPAVDYTCKRKHSTAITGGMCDIHDCAHVSKIFISLGDHLCMGATSSFSNKLLTIGNSYRHAIVCYCSIFCVTARALSAAISDSTGERNVHNSMNLLMDDNMNFTPNSYNQISLHTVTNAYRISSFASGIFT